MIEAPTWEVIHGDCLEVMRGMEAESVDAVVTDPPYGISDSPIQGQGRTGKRAGAVNTWHPLTTWDGAIDPGWCSAVCAAADVVAWMGNWRKRESVESSMPHRLRCEIVWAKDCHVGPPCPVAMRDERIWIFSKNAISPREFATSVWTVPIIPTWAHRWHKNEKPVPLMARIIRLLTDPGAMVLDPFAGSGTTGVACMRTGRNFIGIEIDPGYCEIARKRIGDAAAQGRLL